MSDDSDGVKIDFISMHLLAKHFWSHVAGRSTCIKRLFAEFCPSYSKICEPKVPNLIKYQIFRFDVSVENLLPVDVLHRDDDTGDQEFRLFFAKFVFVG